MEQDIDAAYGIPAFFVLHENATGQDALSVLRIETYVAYRSCAWLLVKHI